MIIGIVTVRLSLPESRSLKDKRSVLRRLKDRILNKMNVSVAEVGEQDAWKSAEMAFVTVAASSQVVQKRIADISSYLRSDPRHVLIDLHTEMI